MATLTIKNIPDELYQTLKAQALQHRRSLNSEVIVSLEKAVSNEKPDKQVILKNARHLREKTAQYRITQKKLKKAKEDDRTEEEMIELRNKIEILKRPGGFEAIFLYVHSEWVDDSRRLDHSMKQIEVILYRNSPERIEQLRIEYNSKNEILSWLETLEPEEADKIYKKIWFASDINNYRLVMENGTRVLKNIKDQPQAPKQISNDTDKRPGI